MDRLDAEAAAAAAARCACHVSGIKMARTTARGALDQAQLPPRQPCLRPAVTYSKSKPASPAGPACHKLFSGVRPDRDAKLSLSLSVVVDVSYTFVVLWVETIDVKTFR